MINGNWSGFDVDMCRAMASAVLGDPQGEVFVPLKRKPDLLPCSFGEAGRPQARNTTWTMQRDATWDWNSTKLLRRSGFHGAQEPWCEQCYGARRCSACTNTGTTTELNLTDFFRANKCSLN